MTPGMASKGFIVRSITGIGRCRMMVAVPESRLRECDAARARIRVATKYVSVARDHFAEKGMHADLIKLPTARWSWRR